MRTGTIDANAILSRALEMSQPLMAARQQHLECTVSDTPMPVQGDTERLGEALGSLLRNAAYCTAEGGTIRLLAHREGGHFVLTVHGSHGGIKPLALQGVSDPEQSRDLSEGEADDGRITGLSLVQGIVESHGGTVQATSGDEAENEVGLRLPLVSDLHPNSGEVDAPLAIAPRGTRRVLVVDDNPDSSESLAYFLRLKGHDARACFSGQQALNVAKGFRPDAVVLDIGLPDMNGYEVARRLRADEHGHALRLIAVTGYGREEDRARTRESGFDAHLTKPVDPDILQRFVC